LIQSGPGRLLAVACRSNFGQLPTECRLSTGSPKRPDNRARWVPLARSACSQRPYNLLGFPGMMPDIANIGDKETLLSVLSRVDISVPGRSKGRKTKHTEIWMICHLLSTLAHNERLSYPVSVVHRDRPDFLVRNGNREIGVEATEGITPELQAAVAKPTDVRRVGRGRRRAGVGRAHTEDCGQQTGEAPQR